MPASSKSSIIETRDIVARVDQAIAGFLDHRGLPENLDAAIRYAILGGGKRLRPVLAWRSAEACGADGSNSLAAGVAVELIHAFSLVHDDLPAMDDDDMRHGRPTLHIHAGEAMAILAGDAMLTLAFEAATDPSFGLDPATISSLLGELCAGTSAMIAGQVYDTLGGFDDDLGEEARLKLIHRNKTGALIRASCRMGAICAHASDAQLGSITAYSEAIGLQFQVVDDLLDAEGDSATVGKATGKDADAGKLTYPGVVGIEESRRIAKELHDRAERSASALGASGRGLVDLLEQLTHRTH